MNCPFCHNDQGPVVSGAANYVRCPECDLVYLRDCPSAEESVARYQRYADGDSHMRLPETIEQLATSGLRRHYFFTELSEFCPPPFDLLDIGSGWGAFLLGAREAGCRVGGVEVCSKMATFATNVLGIRTRTEQLETFLAEVDVVTMLHVFEHLPNAKTALDAVKGFLRPGGIFAGIVPNYASYASRTLGDKWAWFDPHFHYYQWTPKTLQTHLTGGGFTVLKLYTTTGDYDLKRLRDLLEKEASRPLSDVELADRLREIGAATGGEEIRFFARKG